MLIAEIMRTLTDSHQHNGSLFYKMEVKNRTFDKIDLRVELIKFPPSRAQRTLNKFSPLISPIKLEQAYILVSSKQCLQTVNC